MRFCVGNNDETAHPLMGGLKEKHDENLESQKEKEMMQNKKNLDEDAARMEKDIKDLNEQIKRMQADFENYKSRLLRDAEESRKYAAEKIICQQLPLLDNLERAIKSADETKNMESFKQGIELIYKQMRDIFEKEGLKQIDCIGATFDPNIAEVLMCEDNPQAEDETITEEFEKGYQFKDKIIRPAKVKICKRSETK